MPFTMKGEGLQEINDMLGKLENNANQIAAFALYEGAGIMADEFQNQARKIRTAKFRYAGGGTTRLPSPEEKEAVESAAGIARFENEGGAEINTSVGYANSGYADIGGKYKPIPLIAASINSGTSFMKKQPFIRKAVTNGTKKAVAAMKESIEKGLEALTKE